MSYLRIQLPVIQPTPPCGKVPVPALPSVRTEDSGRRSAGAEPRTQDLSAIRRGGPHVVDPSRREPNLVLDGEGGLELSTGQPNSGAIVGNSSSPDQSSLAAGHALFDFAPSPAAQSQLLEALSDPTFSLLSLARTYNTDLDALIVWMEQPDIQERLNAIHNVTIRRNQLAAASRIPRVIVACEDILNGYSDEELNNPIRRTDTPAIEQRRRSRLIALKAANLIARISRWSSPPRVARLSEPGRSDPAATNNAPVPRPARSLESLRAELAALPTRQHRPQGPDDNRVERPSAQIQSPPRQGTPDTRVGNEPSCFVTGSPTVKCDSPPVPALTPLRPDDLTTSPAAPDSS